MTSRTDFQYVKIPDQHLKLDWMGVKSSQDQDQGLSDQVSLIPNYCVYRKICQIQTYVKLFYPSYLFLSYSLVISTSLNWVGSSASAIKIDDKKTTGKLEEHLRWISTLQTSS